MTTREEEIVKAAYDNDRESLSSERKYFIEGARWADEHPRKGLVDINKVCQWLRYYRWKYEDSREGNEVMEKDIRKAMEE